MGIRSTSAGRAAALGELFRDRRMVLDLPCGGGAFLKQLRDRGVPGIGIDPDPDTVRRCREARFPTWAGTWQVIGNHRQKFDGIRVSVDACRPEDLPAMLATLSEGLVPRGILAITGPADPRLVEAYAPDLEMRSTSEDTLILTRRVRPTRASQGLVVGTYADAFVDREHVLEMGCGRGHFLDALRVRDIRCRGIEWDEQLAAEARSRGHDVDSGLAYFTGDRLADFDGIYLGNLADKLELSDVEALLAVCLHSLIAGGRVLVRTAHGIHDPRALLRACDTLGFAGVSSSVAPGDAQDYCVTATRPVGIEADTDQLGRAEKLTFCTRTDPINQPLTSLHDLERFEQKTSSQGGEDGVLQAIFAHIGTTNRYYVEFGCGDGVQCNTALLRRQGWQGLLMDGMADPAAEDAVIHKEWIAAETINDLFDKHGVPSEFDLLSIDIDGNDYWVWDAIRSRPRVVVIEYNANLAVDQSLTIPYDPGHRWDGSDYYGASLLALAKLGEKKGYTLVYCNRAGVNAFFVCNSLVGGLAASSVADIHRSPNYWYRGFRQYPDLSKVMVEV